MKPILVNLPQELIDQIDKQAEKEHRSRTKMIHVLLEQAIKKVLETK